MCSRKNEVEIRTVVGHGVRTAWILIFCSERCVKLCVCLWARVSRFSSSTLNNSYTFICHFKLSLSHFFSIMMCSLTEQLAKCSLVLDFFVLVFDSRTGSIFALDQLLQLA